MITFMERTTMVFTQAVSISFDHILIPDVFNLGMHNVGHSGAKPPDLFILR